METSDLLMSQWLAVRHRLAQSDSLRNDANTHRVGGAEAEYGPRAVSFPL
jgi:hypothetical protein